MRVTIKGLPTIPTTVMVYRGVAWTGLRRGQLVEWELGLGQTVDVTVGLDDRPREVEVPPELTAVLDAHPAAAELYRSPSFTHRKEYARWVGEAKQAQTRQRRAARAGEMLLGQRRTAG